MAAASRPARSGGRKPLAFAAVPLPAQFVLNSRSFRHDLATLCIQLPSHAVCGVRSTFEQICAVDDRPQSRLWHFAQAQSRHLFSELIKRAFRPRAFCVEARKNGEKAIENRDLAAPAPHETDQFVVLKRSLTHPISTCPVQFTRAPFRGASALGTSIFVAARCGTKPSVLPEVVERGELLGAGDPCTISGSIPSVIVSLDCHARDLEHLQVRLLCRTERDRQRTFAAQKCTTRRSGDILFFCRWKRFCRRGLHFRRDIGGRCQPAK
jgi:hypothetical protein